ncbi:GntR family transcriptional regulator [Actimicrobium antarcticum]|uniref:GntR family transcriptional regulator n=1 Tax=Actimicrobium antarcticum TaxID=1051899 RepID=A0ABP7TPU3_9BURK
MLASIAAAGGSGVSATERIRGARADEISKKIADDIVLGRFEPGSRLDEAMLAGLFGVSRTPVREALKQLAIQGLVVSRPNRGSIVAALTPEQRDRMFEAIGELEAACARHAAIRMSMAERDHLCALHAQSREAMRAGDADLYDRLNHELHQVIIQACGNPVLIDMALGLRHRIAPFRRSQFRDVERMSASFEEHAVIIEALLAHDVTTAQRQMRAHLMSARSAAARVSPGWSEGSEKQTRP